MQYLAKWNSTLVVNDGKLGDNPRPNPMGMLFDNTTVEGSWIHPVNMHDASIRFGRTIDNRTMVMPHSGIVEVSRLPENNMFSQPGSDVGIDLPIFCTILTCTEGFGEMSIDASVVSPAVNVLCANASEEELAPIVYKTWPNDRELDSVEWPVGYDIPVDFQNRTILDEIFGFGPLRPPPVFPRYPAPFNTILNATGGQYPDAIYILIASSVEKNYMLCSLSTTLEPGCSTKLNSTFRGAIMQTNCDEDNSMAYDTLEPIGIRVRDWVTVASQWAFALSIGSGITDGASANSRLLSQMIPQGITPNDTSPTLAEALCVLAGCTLLNSGINASPTSTVPFPFPPEAVQLGDHSGILITPTMQPFSAKVQIRDYASGPQEAWQDIFYLVLVSVFLLSLACVVYFSYVLHIGGIVSDFIEPQNLFALALNSPGSAHLAGSCGAGPEGTQMLARWYVRVDEHEHVFVADADTARAEMMGPGRNLGYHGGPAGNAGGGVMSEFGTPAGFREQFDVEDGGRRKSTGLSPTLESPTMIGPALQRKKYSRLGSGG